MKYTDLQIDIGFSVNAAASVSQEDAFISVNMLFIIDLFSYLWLICITSPDIVLFYLTLMYHLTFRANTMHSPTSLFNLYLCKGNQSQAGFPSFEQFKRHSNEPVTLLLLQAQQRLFYQDIYHVLSFTFTYYFRG